MARSKKPGIYKAAASSYPSKGTPKHTGDEKELRIR